MNTLKILITGDISTWNIENFSTNNIDRQIISKIKDSDLFITNLEGPIVNDVSEHRFTLYGNKLLDFCFKCILSITNKKQPIVYSDNKITEFLKLNPNTVVTLANNHVKDCGRSGLTSTLKCLSENKIDYLGAGFNIEQANKYIHKKIADKDIFIMNYNRIGLRKYGLFANIYGASKNDFGAAYLSFWKIKDSIRKIKDKFPNAVTILIVHDGRVLPENTNDLKLKLKSYQSCNSDLTIIHHPHLSWNLNLDTIKVIGDCIFYQPSAIPEIRTSSMTEFSIKKQLVKTEEVHIGFNKGYPYIKGH